MKNQTFEKALEDIKNNPEANKWLNSFKYGNKDEFIKNYLELKYKLAENPPNSSTNDNYRSNPITVAENALEALLGKKLFDLELQWRAKEITIEGVEVSDDFRFWVLDVACCPFLSEITKEEKEIMKSFLTQSDFRFSQFQDHRHKFHEEILKDLIHNPENQSWFTYYNKTCKNPIPIDLPDYKGEKEEYYLEMYHKLKKEQKPTYKSSDNKKYMNYSDTLRALIILTDQSGENEFNQHLKDKLKHYEGSNPVECDYAYYYLNIHNFDNIPLKPNENWAEAIYIAYEQHAAREAVKHFDSVCETYQIKKENNMLESRYRNNIGSLSNHVKKMILEARRLLNEPENFDY